MERRGLLAWFAGNSVAANILMVGLILAGLYMVSTMRTEVFPEIDPRTVTVEVPYAGASPEEVESGITKRIESALSGLSGIARVSSTAAEGQGTITADLTGFADPDTVLTDVRDAVDALTDFPPEGAEDPVITKSKPEPQLLTLALYGSASDTDLRQTAERLQSDLLATNQLANVSLTGVRAYEVTIEVTNEVLERYGLSITDIAQSVTGSSVDLAGGTVRTDNGDILLRTTALRTTAAEFGAIPVLVQENGAVVRLSEVADIRDGFAEGQVINLYNGAPAVFLNVYRAQDQGVIPAEEVVRDYLTGVSLPTGMALEIRDNDTDELRDRTNLMLRNAVFGFGLVFLTLVLFLDLKLAFWTSAAIPISFLGGLAIAGLLGASINMVSLFALILVLGIVVDDAVVIGENIFEAQSRGGDPAKAALTGLFEVATPVTLGVLTTIMAFFPLAFATGTLGQIVSVVPIVVIAILAVSLIEGLLILPSHLSHGGAWSLGPLKWVQSGFAAGLRAFTDWVVRPLVRLAVTFRYATMAAVGMTIMVAATSLFTGFMSFVFLPPTEADRVELTLTMPDGAPFETTQSAAIAALTAMDQLRRDLEAEGIADPVLSTSATIGQATGSGDGPGAVIALTRPNVAQVRVDLLPSDLRAISSTEVETRWRDALGALPAAESVSFSSGLFSLGDDISINLSHETDATLLLAAEDLRARLEATNGVSDVALSLTAGQRQLDFQLNTTGIALGLTDGDLARQIRRAFFGETVQTLQRGLEEVSVVIRHPEDARRSLSDIYDLRISLPGGDDVPLMSVAEVRESRGYAEILRSDGQRVLTVTAKVDSSIVTADEVNADLVATVLPAMTEAYPGLTAGQSEDAEGRSDDLQSLFGAFGIAMLGIFVMLAAFTRSYVLPIVILTTVIYGVIGAFIGHWLLGYPLTFISLFGIVALAGVVINDTILLLDDYRRRLKRAPQTPKALAIVDSAARRFRPILMTTLSTGIGLLPMIFEPSQQAAFLVPMAISLGAGILIATPILLLAIPATVLILDDLARPVRWVARANPTPKPITQS